MNYADVILSITHKNLDKPFTYHIPNRLKGEITIGKSVMVPLGKANKPRQAYVIGFTEKVDFPTKDIISTVKDEVLLDDKMLETARWMSEKYHAAMAQCLKTILPPQIIKIKKPIKNEALDFKPRQIKTLTSDQQNVLNRVINNSDLTPALIHGVTGSGKTEVYMEIIQEVLIQKKEAIVLVPEISLTPQTVERFLNRFGPLVNFTHSRLSAKERFTIWHRAKHKEISIVIGPRSAVFTPFADLGIIIIDEEHDGAYKSDTTPKYDARAVALKRGELHNAQVVLGSATPGVDSYYKALSGEYKLFSLPNRINLNFPNVKIIDMREELSKGNTSIFSVPLRIALEENFAGKRQTILFLNRRGFSTFISCRNCGHVLECKDCSVNYTYHKMGNKLMCHYCGAGEKNPSNCPVCGSKFIKAMGLGTQRVEKEVRELLPHARVLRMDMDTTSRKHSHESILTQFKNEGDILVGTQMIAKGLDFPKVTLVGIMLADTSINMGDYRSGEITYQLLTQVSGRAGRADDMGEVYIQTYNPGHYSIIHSRDNDYSAFYNQEISFRKQRFYPPFAHVFMILFVGAEEKEIIAQLFNLKNIMDFYQKKRPIFDILGPVPAIVSKIKNNYRWKIIVKCEFEDNLRNFVIFCLKELSKTQNLKNINVNLTLDPAVIV